MVLHLRIPNKFLLGLFSLTGATVVGAVWTFSGDADTASKGPAVNVPVIGATYPNYNGATSTTRRGGRYVSQSSYVSQMLTLAAGSYKYPFSREDRHFGANGVESKGVDSKEANVSVNRVQVFSVNLGNPAAFAEHPSIPRRPGQTPLIDDQPVVSPPNSDPPPRSVPDSGGTFLLMLCSGAGVLIMRMLAARQLEK